MNKEFSRGFWREGVPFIWLSGFAALILVGMIVGLVGLILAKGATHFWPSPLVQITMKNGNIALGQIMATEAIPDWKQGTGGSPRTRTLLKIANRDVYGLDFKWFDNEEIVDTQYPANAVVIERAEYGNLNGFVKGFKTGPGSSSSSTPDFYSLLNDKILLVQNLLEEIEGLTLDLLRARRPVTVIETEIRRLEYGALSKTPGVKSKIEGLKAKKKKIALQKGEKISFPAKRLKELQIKAASYQLEVVLASGEEITFPLENVVALYRPNSMVFFEKTFHYLKNVWRFLFHWPRESNTEGGVFPAIFGTVMMVFIMTITTTPLGVLTAIYLREYAKPGLMLSLARLAVSNLAGVPSIVFGIFGLGFFIYFAGGGLDRLFFADKLPTPTFGTGGILWASLTLALLTVPVVVVATEEGLASVPLANKEGSLALGASKYQTIKHVVLPNAMPGILTGVILAISRGAGEVAPLMITGVVKLTSSLPVDSHFPFFHLDRKFMHLGFHIYDVGFQAPNVEAAKPMVYTTTLLLLVMVIVLNMVAITLRNKLRKKYKGGVL